MCFSHPSVGDQSPKPKKDAPSFLARACLSALPLLWFVPSLAAQDVGSEENELFGSGAVITVKVHDPSGEALASSAVVKLFRGVVPSGQRDTSNGVAEFVVRAIGEFTVVVAAPGYPEVQKELSVLSNGRAQVDVYLRPVSPAGSVAGVPGRPVLTPKAKKALDKGILALKENRVGDAEKYLGEAMRLASGNPDVLYAQGVLSLKQRNWEQARTVLEKATQIDPNSARAFAALGMALCDSRRYDAAISPLEKSLQLDRAGTWQTRWALAKSYYHERRFDEALNVSQEALAQSHGEGPEIALLVAQSLTAMGRYEDAAQRLREFLRDHANRTEAAMAKRWLEQLAADGKIRAN